MSIELREVKRFWLVHYFPSSARTWTERLRHRRVKLFFNQDDALRFAGHVWHNPHHRLLSVCEMLRTGFGPLLPF